MLTDIVTSMPKIISVEILGLSSGAIAIRGRSLTANLHSQLPNSNVKEKRHSLDPDWYEGDARHNSAGAS